MFESLETYIQNQFHPFCFCPGQIVPKQREQKKTATTTEIDNKINLSDFTALLSLLLLLLFFSLCFLYCSCNDKTVNKFTIFFSTVILGHLCFCVDIFYLLFGCVVVVVVGVFFVCVCFWRGGQKGAFTQFRVPLFVIFSFVIWIVVRWPHLFYSL